MPVALWTRTNDLARVAPVLSRPIDEDSPRIVAALVDGKNHGPQVAKKHPVREYAGLVEKVFEFWGVRPLVFEKPGGGLVLKSVSRKLRPASTICTPIWFVWSLLLFF